MARRYGLAVSEKPDSQDICFVPNGRYSDVAALALGRLMPAIFGILMALCLVVTMALSIIPSASVVGLALADEEADESEGPLYVVGIDSDSNTVLVGPRAALACREVHLHDVNWINGQPENGTRVLARLRNTAPATSARIFYDRTQGAPLIIFLMSHNLAAGQVAAPIMVIMTIFCWVAAGFQRPF